MAMGVSLDIPKEICDLCVDYINLNHDEFIINEKADVEVVDNRVIGRQFAAQAASGGIVHIYMRNVVKTGINIWRFKYIEEVFDDADNIWVKFFKRSKYSSIGIFKSKHEMKRVSKIEDVNGYWISFRESDGIFRPQQTIYNEWESIENGDLIDIRLDMNDLSLSIRINDKEYIKMFDVEDTEYRAIVSVNLKTADWKFVSYQHIY